MIEHAISIVDRSQLFLDALEQLIRSFKFSVLESAKSLQDLRPKSLPNGPEVLVYGIDLHTDLDLQFERACCAWAGSSLPRVVILTPLLDRNLLLRAAAAGVDAVLSKDISGEVLRRTLELVMLGQQVFPPTPGDSKVRPQVDILIPARAAVMVAQSSHKDTPPPIVLSVSSGPHLVREAWPGTAAPGHARAHFSEREDQVLRRLFAGEPNKVIARDLGITEGTVKVHVKSLCRKLGAANRTQAAIRGAPRIGLSGLQPANGIAPIMPIIAAIAGSV
jgi:two-component system nitrate/nitrite response regulator NarL